MLKCSMRVYTTIIICLTVFFLFADQNLLAPNLSAIAEDFGFDDHKRDKYLGGNIAFGFFIVGGSFALIIGYFTDTMNRCKLFGLVVLIGESACLGTYWVDTYGQLFLCRVLTGISFGGATPIIFSILGDHYSGSSRIYVSTLVGIASSAGVSIGQLLAGTIGPLYGWRTPFVIVASPAILLAILVFFTVEEPKRGNQEDAMKKLRASRPTNINDIKKTLHNTILYYHNEGVPDPIFNPLTSPKRKTADSLEQTVLPVAFAEPTGSFISPHDPLGSSSHSNSKVKTRNNSLVSNTFPQVESHEILSSEGEQKRGKFVVADEESGGADMEETKSHRHNSVSFREGSCVHNNIDTLNPLFSSNHEHALHSCFTIINDNDDVDDEDELDYVKSGGTETSSEFEYSEKLDWQKVVHLFRTPSVLIIFLQGFPGCLPWGMIFVFLNDYLASDRGLTVQAATAALTTFGIGGLVGQLFGGWLGQWLYNRYSPIYQCYLMGISTLLAVPPAVYILNTTDLRSFWFYFVCFLFGGIVNINGPNVRAVLQNVCMPEIRGTAFSIFTLTDDIGKGLGPALVVMMIEDFHGNRRRAFTAVVYFWLFCGAMLLCLSLTVVRDEKRVQRKITAAITGEVDRGSCDSGDSHSPRYRQLESASLDLTDNGINSHQSRNDIHYKKTHRHHHQQERRFGSSPSRSPHIHINVTGLLRLETHPPLPSSSSYYPPGVYHSHSPLHRNDNKDPSIKSDIPNNMDSSDHASNAKLTKE